MRYLPISAAEQESMLGRIGAKDQRQLFDSIPPAVRLAGGLPIEPGLPEHELRNLFRKLAGANRTLGERPSFLGAGNYRHFCPGVPRHLALRGEFITSYTPYQAEIAQGTLTAIFEWQTMTASLAGMDVSNASVYDGATAAAEAVLMARRIRNTPRVLVSAGVNPRYREVIRTYTRHQDTDLVEIPLGADGRTDAGALSSLLAADTCAVVVQSPNFLGVCEDQAALFGQARAASALAIGVVTEALSLAFLEPPGACGADICAGEGQSFGLPVSYGGPNVGILACRDAHKRQLPGRLVGRTLDADGKPGFVLTLTAREQHIRRAKATSNICTNQGLMMLFATMYLELMGPAGLKELAEVNHAKACYLRGALEKAGFAMLHPGAPIFNEFAILLPAPADQLAARLEAHGLGAGLPLRLPDGRHAMLLAATELLPRADLDRFVSRLAEVAR